MLLGNYFFTGLVLIGKDADIKENIFVILFIMEEFPHYLKNMLESHQKSVNYSIFKILSR